VNTTDLDGNPYIGEASKSTGELGARP